MKARSFVMSCLLGLLVWPERLEAVMFIETGDAAHHTASPGDNSGWQYEGKFNSYLGVPIAPHFFITANHFGGTVGEVLDFHGDPYTTIAYQDCPGTDLRIWEVDHAKPFPTYAPLSSGAADLGATATVFGRGTQRGVEFTISGQARGWLWGTADGVKRWGRNMVTGTVNGGVNLGELLYCDFDNSGIPDECHLSTGDSGGGLFVMEEGLWRLAGINYAVDGPLRTIPSGTPVFAALHDARDMEYEDPPGIWVPVVDTGVPVPTSFYASRISASMTWIAAEVPEVGTLALEDFPAWRKLYFSPAQIADPMTADALADPDHDGICNLLEFALNLDPLFNESARMEAGVGLRGLPLVRMENIPGSDRLTIEYVRRSGGSGAGLDYVAEFSADLENWSSAGSETVTPINTRWERVKVADALSVLDDPHRTARLRVVLPD